MEIQSQKFGNDNLNLLEIERAIADAITLFRDDRWSGLLKLDDIVPGSVPLNPTEFGTPKDKSIAPSEPFSESEAA